MKIGGKVESKRGLVNSGERYIKDINETNNRQRGGDPTFELSSFLQTEKQLTTRLE